MRVLWGEKNKIKVVGDQYAIIKRLGEKRASGKKVTVDNGSKAVVVVKKKRKGERERRWVGVEIKGRP